MLITNIVKELRRKKGIQQKELALAIGVSCPTISAWEQNKKDPKGERLKKLAQFFGVDELVVLGRGSIIQPLFVPEDPSISGMSETEQIVKRLLEKLDPQPKTEEARILAKAVDRMPKEQRERALAIFRVVFASHADDFEKGTEQYDT